MKATPEHFSWRTIALHWLMVPLVIGLFGLGFTMVDLDYYHPWYTRAPRLHESIGALVIVLWTLRLLNCLAEQRPAPLPEVSPKTHRLAQFAHAMLYLLLALQLLTGYLISTADGAALEVFTWVSLPALFSGFEGQEDLAGRWHQNFSWALMSLVLIHSLATLKHHFIDRDATLLRMLGRNTSQSKTKPKRHV